MSLTRTQKLALLNDVVKRHDALKAAWKPLTDAVRNHDFPAWEESWHAFDAYVKAVELLLDDSFENVSWFVIENDCGRKALGVRKAGWPEPRPVRTTADLLDFIEHVNDPAPAPKKTVKVR